MFYAKGDFIGDKFEVLDVIGRGGCGVVYLVQYYNKTDKTVEIYALKTILDEYLDSPLMRERFRKEAQTWINFSKHPNIVKVGIVDEIAGRLYIAMEYIAPSDDGLSSLDDYLRNNPPNLVQSLHWGIQFCHGMEYAYSRGLKAHRDIKPSNILINFENLVKITDFGLAGILDSLKNISISSISGFDKMRTNIGTAMGTPTHMSPEQFIDASSCDERSDIYSFGVVLYQLATMGKAPFFTENMSHFWDIMKYHHAHSPVPKISSLIFPFIQKCLEKNPCKRYQHFVLLRNDLESFLKQLNGEVVKPPEISKHGIAELMNRGISLTSLGRYEEAIAYYDIAIDRAPLDSDVWMNKGIALSKLGKPKEATDCYDYALKINPKSSVILTNKGVSLFKLGKYQAALQCFNKGIEADPQYSQAWNNMGALYAEMNRFQAAIDCFDKALTINTKYLSAWNNKGVALARLNRYSDALLCFNKALEIDPGNALAWYEKGLSLSELNQLEEMIKAFQNVVKLASSKQKTLSEMAKYILDKFDC